MNYKGLKEQIVKEVGGLLSQHDFTRHVRKQGTFQLAAVEGCMYVFTPVTAYRDPQGEHDGYAYIYSLTCTKYPSKAGILVMWYGNFNEDGEVELFCDFKDFEFVQAEQMTYYVDLRNKEQTIPWVQTSAASNKHAAVLNYEKVLKILKQYDIPTDFYEKHFDEQDPLMTFENVTISKKKNEFIIKYYFDKNVATYSLRGKRVRDLMVEDTVWVYDCAPISGRPL